MVNDRGQTTQDFAVGVSVLLLSVIGAFVFSQGGTLAVYEGTSPGVEQTQADRIASYIVENYSVDGRSNVLRYTPDSDDGGIEELDDGDSDLSKLKLQAGVNVSSDRRVDPIVGVRIVNNSTLAEGERTPAKANLSLGQSRDSEFTSASRVVTLENDGTQCTPVCWLVVRVW